MLVILSLLAGFAPVPEPVKDELTHLEAVVALAWTPDSKLAITATGNGVILLWNGQTGAKVETLSGHPKPIRDLSPAGKLLASLDTSGERPMADALLSPTSVRSCFARVRRSRGIDPENGQRITDNGATE
jgi:WD40 repeat protein